MNNHFFIPYFGNKRQEVKKIYDEIKNDINDIEYIVEPFCGSSALSYYISLQQPQKYKYVLNDNNNFLIELCNIAKDEIKLNKLVDDLKIIYNDVYNDKNKYKNVCMNAKKDLKSHVFSSIYYNIRPGIFPSEKRPIKIDRFDKILKCPIINFLRTENIIFSSSDWFNIYDEYKNKNSFIFLDPPYLSSCNDFYFNKNINVYEYLLNHDINEEKNLICLCLEDIWIIRLLFKNKQITGYEKRYFNNKKKKTTHIIIKNNKFSKK